MIGPAAARFLRDLVLVLSLLLVCCLYVTRCLAIPRVVLGPSMRPTLEAGDRVVVDLWTYRRRPPRPGEVVLLDGPGEVPLVKRVTSGPLARDRVPASSPFGRAEANEDWFVVRGDNEAESTDSRQFGPVPRHRFRGRVLFRYWPPGRGWRIR